MSKPCQGIVLKSMTGAEIAKQQPAVTAVPRSRYLPPIQRKLEVKTLSKEDLDSTDMFPAMQEIQPSTANGASWSQIRMRLAQPINMKLVVEEAIERERKASEEGIRQEQETDPLKMTKNQRETNGWATLAMPKTNEEVRDIVERIRPQTVKEDELYLDNSEWGLSPFAEDAMNDANLFMKRFKCVNADGTPIIREKKRVVRYFS